MLRKLLLSSVIGLLVFQAFGLRRSVADPAATQIRLFRPKGVEITKVVKGTCRKSFVDSRAFRCFTGSIIRDACFPGKGMLVCPKSPWSKKAVGVKLKRRGAPWGIRLYDGQRCVFVTGATFVVGEKRANYMCKEGWGIGRPNRGSDPWTIGFVTGPDDTSVETKSLSTAWW